MYSFLSNEVQVSAANAHSSRLARRLLRLQVLRVPGAPDASYAAASGKQQRIF
jgi:hypothetical protein